MVTWAEASGGTQLLWLDGSHCEDFTVLYLSWELLCWNREGLLKDRTTWREQAHVHCFSACQIQQILWELCDIFGKHCWDKKSFRNCALYCYAWYISAFFPPHARDVFPQGLPDEYAFVTTFKFRKASRKEDWYIWQIIDKYGIPQVWGPLLSERAALFPFNCMNQPSCLNLPLLTFQFFLLKILYF